MKSLERLSAAVMLFAMLALLSACGGSSSGGGTTPPPGETITATGGTPQSATVNAPFTSALQATVSTGGTPNSGVTVTFTATTATSGATGTFGGTNTATATTDQNGNAMAAITANGTAGSYTVTATASGASGTATFSLTNNPQAAITATAGTPQSTAINTAFGAKLQATVLQGTTPQSGVTVTFTAPSSGAGGTFGGQATATAVTDGSGNALSPAFTANGTFGSYVVTATASGVSGTADFTLSNTISLTGDTLYSFYLSGSEAINAGPNFYALAGSIALDSNGNVVAGEQDYNDGFGLTSPQPSGDAITSGSLSVDPSTGLGTLTLVTDNANLGAGGTETFDVQFVNAKHALIVQFDGTATSSGSLDLQTLNVPLAGGYAFTLAGVDAGQYMSVVYGGVFTVSAATFFQNGGTLQGTYDVDDFGAASTPTLGANFSGTISAPDEFGRGTILGTGIAGTLNYYMVGPEALRVVDVDDVPGIIGDSMVGSAFGQGTPGGGQITFTNSSLGTSIFQLQSTWQGNIFAAVGMFTTNPGAGTFSGFADDNEVQNGVQASTAISGTYSLSNTINGYGSLTFSSPLGDIRTLGIYMAAVSISDPNNTTNGYGSALLVDLDGADLNGVGMVAATETISNSQITGGYVFGAQEFNLNINGGEFDFAGAGSITNLVFGGTGFVSDPWAFFKGGTTDSNVSFSGTA
ncbi:MAG TPA: hypothetical protein VND65_20585, partial [Candidatus Binatia bacterium]|nr:hypothetical protein [Candidatus Binatia bacterium]